MARFSECEKVNLQLAYNNINYNHNVTLAAVMPSIFHRIRLLEYNYDDKVKQKKTEVKTCA